MEDDVRTRIVYETDQASVDNAKKGAQTVKNAIGSVDKDLEKTARGATALQKELGSIARATQLDRIGKEMGEVARKTGNTAEAVADLTKKLKELGATEGEVRRTASAFESARSGDSSGGGGFNVNKFRGVASAVGLGDAANFIDDIQDAKEGLGGFRENIGGLTGTLGEGILAAGAAGAALLILSAVIADFAEGAQEQADAINATIDANRSVADELAAGATSGDIRDSIEQLQFRRELEKETLAESQASYEKFVQGLRDAFGPLAGLVEGVLKIIDPREQALADQIDKSNQLIQEADARERAYNEALEKGLTSKADAKAAAEEQAKAQEKAEREAERAQEKAKREAEQAQEKAKREQEKAASEAQRQAEQAAAAQEKYSQAVENAGRTFGQSMEDIARKSKQTSADLTKSLGRDLFDGETKYARDVSMLQIKTQRDDIQRLKEHGRKIEDIAREAFKGEEELRKSRNFLAIADARSNTKEEFAAQNRELVRAREDAGDAYKQQRTDLKQALDFEQSDRRLGFSRQREDQAEAIRRDIEMAGIAKRRNLETAALAYQRDQEMLSRHLSAMSGLRQQSYAQEVQMGRSGGFNGSVPVAGNGLIPMSTIGNSTISHSTVNNRSLTLNSNSDMQTTRLLRDMGY